MSDKEEFLTPKQKYERDRDGFQQEMEQKYAYLKHIKIEQIKSELHILKIYTGVLLVFFASMLLDALAMMNLEPYRSFSRFAVSAVSGVAVVLYFFTIKRKKKALKNLKE